MSKAAQGFSPEAYLKYVEGGNPRRTLLIVKIAIYGWKLTRTYLKNNLSDHGGVAKWFKMLTYYVYAPLFHRFAPCPEL